MSQASDLTAREAEIIRILKVLRSHSNRFVVIGGYAVSALSEHRFSVDCDVVIDKKKHGSFEKMLIEEGYGKVKAKSLLRRIRGAKTAKYSKVNGGRTVSVDLYENSVLSRNTGGSGATIRS